MKNFILILSSVALAVVGQLLLKKGMSAEGQMTLSITAPLVLAKKVFSNMHLFLGFASFGLSSIVWLVVLSKVELSYAYPMVSLGYVLVLIASKFFFGEVISVMRWASIIVICAGVIMLSRS